MMRVICISGKAGHGKDTFGEDLKECLEYRDKKVVVLHYADLVKFYAAQYFGVNNAHKDAHAREIYQYVGTDLMRAYNENYWVDIIAEFLDALDKENKFDVALIPDARFPNEIERLEEFGLDVTPVRVIRYTEDNRVYESPTTPGGLALHPSETALDSYRYWSYIVENCSLDGLHESAEAILIDMGLIEEDK